MLDKEKREKADDVGNANPGGGEPRDISNKGAPALSDDHGMPLPLVGWGIAVGLILVASGSLMMIFVARVANVAGLMACIGFGIILVAFGARAAGNWRSWSVTGGGAMAVLLFLLLQSYTPKPPAVAPFVYGYIRGASEMRDVAVVAHSPFLVGRPNPQSDWEFFAREEWLTGDIFSVIAVQAEGSPPNRIIIGCVPISLLRQTMGNRDGIDFTLSQDSADAAKQQWLLVRTGTDKSKRLGVFGNPACPVEGREPLDITWLLRQATDLAIPASMAAESSADITAIFAGLNGESLNGQSQAQGMVAQLRDPKTIGEVVQKWGTPDWNDRLDTSLVVAWVSGIRQNRAVAVPIASALSRGQLDHIVELTGSRDRTTRYNAAELLSWLLQSTAWPNPPPADHVKQVFEAVVSPFVDPTKYSQSILQRGGSFGDVWYNTLVALQDAKCDMRPEDREHAVAVLRSFESSDFIHTSTNFVRTAAMSSQFRQKVCR